jgi:hypothetical protein
MTEKQMHEPKFVTDDDAEVTFVECAICGKVLWYPIEECKSLPPLSVNVSDGTGIKDRFGK